MTSKPDPITIGVVQLSLEADLVHKQPGILSRSFLGLGPEESGGRGAG